MISEAELKKLSFKGAPKVSGALPGPKTKEIWDQSWKYESPTRVGGTYLQFVWNEALGATVSDPDGNIFIDMTGGLGVNNCGHNHPKVVETVIKQAPKLMHTLDMVNPPRAALAKRLSEIMPPGLKDNSFTVFDTSGSGAVDTAVKYAKMITRRTEIIGFQGAYHGVYGHSLGLTVSPHYRVGYEPFVPNIHHLPYGYCYRCFIGAKYPDCGMACARYVDYVLNTPYTGITQPACVIVEPIQGEGGYCPPPAEFFPIVAEACKKAGALFIVDEIQAGFGRTGKMWAIEHWGGVEPDMIVWGKGVSEEIPLTGVTIKAEYQSKLEVGSQPATFPGNALACSIALKNIEIMTDQNDELMKRAEIVGEEIMDIFRKAQETSPVIGEVRGKGFMMCVELVKNKGTREPINPEKSFGLMISLMNKGVLNFVCGRYGNVFRFMPPLTTPKEYFETAANTFVNLVKEQEKDLMV
ncbi:MAG: Diaminobutyrate--2-oxoglutarate aminotransferase [Syntrophorhabdus sp. PtaU1.Bin058]|nr:MAG: Diaminobutyrate--2-oxoglutarate aminotransferase [Syntrophorhabdus sp. PtaU1.Bin058]